MNIAVCVRRVPDPEARYRLLDDRTVDFGGAPWMMDPGDAATLEAAVAVAGQHGSGVTVYSVDSEDGEEVLRTSLAQGGESVVRVTGVDPGHGLGAGAALADVIGAGERPELILCGVASSDGGGGATGAALAARLDMPIVQNVLCFDSVSENEATVQRRRDGGYREVVRVQLPAVFTVERIAATPRFPTTREQFRARRATINTCAAEAAEATEVETFDFQMPPPRLQGILWPAPELNARERMQFLVQGGKSGGQSNGGGPVTGDPATVATAIANYLREHGFVAQPVSQED